MGSSETKSRGKEERKEAEDSEKDAGLSSCAFFGVESRLGEWQGSPR